MQLYRGFFFFKYKFVENKEYLKLVNKVVKKIIEKFIMQEVKLI